MKYWKDNISDALVASSEPTYPSSTVRRQYSSFGTILKCRFCTIIYSVTSETVRYPVLNTCNSNSYAATPRRGCYLAPGGSNWLITERSCTLALFSCCIWLRRRACSWDKRSTSAVSLVMAPCTLLETHNSFSVYLVLCVLRFNIVLYYY